MAKKTFKVKCVNVQASAQRVNVMLAADVKSVAGEAGKPAQVTAKTVVSLNFSGDDLAQGKGFEPGKDYTVTID